MSDSDNPYDFRSPIRQRELLAGRGEELAQIDQLLRHAAAGRSAHFSLFGDHDSGKSSLLNAVVEIARERGFLAVKVILSQAMVETELDFYRGIWDAALQTLIEIGRLDPADPWMRAWVLLTCSGELPPDAPQPLELGQLIAAKLHGGMVGHVPTPLLKRDIQRLITVGGERMSGFVLCIDDAELLDRARELAPSLVQLADAAPVLMIVTAAEAAGSLQQEAPRAWAQVEVGPFKHPGDVLAAIARPINDVADALGSKPPTARTAVDIYQLTDGAPYEVNLVCHFIWDSIMQGEQDAFELSPIVIERVIAELEERGRHEASPEIATFSALSAPDLRSLVKVAPYELLTTRQLALLRLMLEDYDEPDLESVQETVSEELKKLEAQNLVRIERDRFTIVGGRNARLYLRYAAQRDTSGELRYRRSYPQAVTARCADELRRTLLGDAYDRGCLFSTGRPHEVGGSLAGRWLTQAANAAANKDIVALADTFGSWITPADLLEHRDQTFTLVALQLQVAVHDVEHLEVLVNLDSRDSDDVRTAVERWVLDHSNLLAKYEARDFKVRCEEISYGVLAAAVAYRLLGIGCTLSYILYAGGAHEAAEELLNELFETATDLVGDDPGDPLLRTVLADALHRRGFMAATRGEWEEALARLAASATMAPAEGWLLDHNRSYVHASQGDFGAAIPIAVTALARYEQDPANRSLLHAFMPTTAGWEAPREGWNIVELHGHWIRRFLELHLLVLRAAEAGDKHDELIAALENLGGSAPVALLRLAGWTQLTVLGSAKDAAALFRRAVAASPYDHTEIPELEAAFAESARGVVEKLGRRPATPGSTVPLVSIDDIENRRR